MLRCSDHAAQVIELTAERGFVLSLEEFKVFKARTLVALVGAGPAWAAHRSIRNASSALIWSFDVDCCVVKNSVVGLADVSFGSG